MTRFPLWLSVVVSFVLMASATVAQDLKPLESKTAQRMGEALAKAAAAMENPQVAIAGDPAKSVGVVIADRGGILLVPQKGVDQGEDNAPDLTVEKGVALAYFFSTPRIVPVIDGKLVDRDKLLAVTVKDKEGNGHEVNCMLLAVRKISDEDYRLYGYGAAAAPIIDVKFTDGKGPGSKPLAVEIKDIDGRTGSIVVTLFDKYQATFRGGVAE